MRSIIKIAGRVRRHRPPSASSEANIVLLDRNWRDVEGRDTLAFRFPGFESALFKLKSDRLGDLLLPTDYKPLTVEPGPARQSATTRPPSVRTLQIRDRCDC